MTKDQYYRNYVELWLDYSSNGECKWRMSSIFSYPVVVQANHPDAVLYDDRGTEDESDDIYHHAFRIGFNSPNAGRTINGFGLKYWFSNEYTDADKSPGFNIPEAIEFYPDSILGDSIGTVQVLEQDLIVSSKESKQYTLSISGKGTYQKLEEDLYEAVFYLDVRNEELYGGTQRGYYKMYNKKNHPEPDPIEKPCINVVEL